MILPPDPKDQWNVILKLIGMAGAVAVFVLSLIQWRKGQAWQRAAKGRELVDKLLESNDANEEYYAWDAMKMLDYQDASKPFLTKPVCLENQKEPAKKERFPVHRAVIERALNSSKKDETDPKLLYVRECFDELYFRLGQLQDAIDNDLVELEHVSCPVDYYATLMARDVELHHRYMERYQYDRALKFLINFPAWRNGCAKKNLFVRAEMDGSGELRRL